MMRTLLPLILLNVALSASLTCQTTAEGYRTNVRSIPSNASAPLLFGNDLVYFDGKNLIYADGKGSRSLLSFATTTSANFIRHLDNDRILFGEFNGGTVWLVHTIRRVAPKKLATIKFNYDAVGYTNDYAIVSAKTGGFSAKTNDLLALNLTTGKTTTIAELPGFSGPVVADTAGNLYHATSEGTADILRFAWRDVWSAFGARVLKKKDATVIYSKLPAASRLALDGDGDLFFSDYTKGKRVGEISDVHSAKPKLTVLVDYSKSTLTPGALQMVVNPQHDAKYSEFEPFQPNRGEHLTIFATDFAGTNKLRVLTPRRPVASLSNSAPPAGARFNWVTGNGPIGGAGLLAIGFGFGAQVIERSYQAPGRESSVLWQPSLLQPTLLLPLTFDRQGIARIELINPGGVLPLKVNTQAVFTSADNRIAGSTTPLRFLLR